MNWTARQYDPRRRSGTVQQRCVDRSIMSYMNAKAVTSTADSPWAIPQQLQKQIQKRHHSLRGLQKTAPAVSHSFGGCDYIPGTAGRWAVAGEDSRRHLLQRGSFLRTTPSNLGQQGAVRLPAGAVGRRP